jgi:hypothetical protein
VIFNGDRDELRYYMRDIADRLGLRDWVFKLSDDPPPRDDDDPEPQKERNTPAAMVHIVYGRKYAIVYVATDWASWTPEELRNTVSHEFIHCHLQGMRWALNNVQNLIPAMTVGVIDGAFRDANEIATDSIATAWAETLPLPVKAKKPRKRKEAA